MYIYVRVRERDDIYRSEDRLVRDYEEEKITFCLKKELKKFNSSEI